MAKVISILLALVLALTGFHAAAQASTREPPLVFGIDFAMDEISCSASFPNGTTVGLVASNGDDAYRMVMRKFFNLCEYAAHAQTLPEGYQFHEPLPKTDAGRKTRFETKYVGDKDVAQLAHAVKQVRGKAYDVLRLRYGVDSLDERPYAAIALPNFLFTTIQPSQPMDDPLPMWQRIDKDLTSPRTHWWAILAAKLSRAVFDAGFRRTGIDEAKSVLNGHDTLSDASPAATCALCRSGLGVCHPHYLGNAELIEPDPCDNSSNVAVVAEMTSNGLSLWVEGVNQCYLDTFSDLSWSKVQSKADWQSWVMRVQQAIQSLLSTTRHQSNANDGVAVIPTGRLWPDDAMRALREAVHDSRLNMTVLELPSPAFAASLGAAAEARIHEIQFMWKYDMCARQISYVEHTEL